MSRLENGGNDPVGKYGLRIRDDRGHKLVDFAEETQDGCNKHLVPSLEKKI